ncbi:MAG: inositol monophosphatase [Candidatus Aenigmarchaeota archaeon]|nr:inositol monophosphatase [Candidatus Aenigmarchaeota archaeon]
MEYHLPFAMRTATNAGSLLMKNWGKTKLLSVVKAGEKGLITEADSASDEFIRYEIRRAYPDHSIVSEEGYPVKGSEFEWVVDPLDGTNNYSRGDPHFSVSIALKYRGESVVGVIHNPAFGEFGDLYYAEKGSGAFVRRNGETSRLHVSGPESRRMSTFSFATGVHFHEPEMFEKIFEKIRGAKLFDHMRGRMLESTAYELCCVADGRFDAHFNNVAEPWDVAAGDVIVREAGGMVTHFAPRSGRKNVMLASNGVVHGELVKIVREIIEDR